MQAATEIPAASRDFKSTSPDSLEGFIGQQHVVAAVKIAIQASRYDLVRFPHTLFVGPPGLGKSNLVQIIANELGVGLQETLAQALSQPGSLAALLVGAEARQIIFIDEADEMEPTQQTLLYRALAENKLLLPRGKCSSSGRCLELDEFTLIMATNHDSRLARPLVERFKVACRFMYYSPEEVYQILSARIARLYCPCEQDVLSQIAHRSRGVPRVALRLLESVHRVARSERADSLTTAHLARMFQIEGIDQRGLDRTERAYLHLLAAEGKPVRLGVIADRLGLPIRTVSSVIEPFLTREGLISRLDEGRTLTCAGAEYLQTA